MTWRWVADAQVADTQVTSLGLDKTFPLQGEAETWLGEFYPDLVDAGIHNVSLYEGDRLVYGPMSLEPAD